MAIGSQQNLFYVPPSPSRGLPGYQHWHGCLPVAPPSISSPSFDLVVAVLYLVVHPAVNPLLYRVRNQELKESLRKGISCMLVNLDKLSITLHK